MGRSLAYRPAAKLPYRAEACRSGRDRMRGGEGRCLRTRCSGVLAGAGKRRTQGWLGGNSSLDEAISAARKMPGSPQNILLMTGFWRGEETEIVRLRLTPTVWEQRQVESLDAAAAVLGVAQHPVHLKVDTGIGRLGVAMEQLPAAAGCDQSSEASFFRRALHGTWLRLKRYGRAIRCRAGAQL